MTEFEVKALDLLERIAVAVERKKPAAKQPDLLDDRALQGKKPLTAMPEPFLMTEQHRAFARARGFQKPDFMFDQFKSHHRAKGSRFAVWDSAWQTWVLNQVKFNGGAPQPTRPPETDGRI